MLDDLDAIVDDVAKEMTSAPLGADVERRVAARIRELAAPRRTVWARPMWLVPTAAVCVLLVAVFVSRNTHDVAPHDVVPRVATPVTTRPTPAVDAATVSEPSPAASRAPQTLPAIGVEAMDVEPITVPAIVETERIDIDPIAIARIEIAPMP